MITVVVGKEIEKIKGDFESVINGMNMVGKIPYDVYSELFDVGTDYIQKAYELGRSELEKRIEELEAQIEQLVYLHNEDVNTIKLLNKQIEENAELKKNFEDSLIACGVLKRKIELLSQPSPLESMQDVLITTQKAQNEKQKAQLAKAKELLKWALHSDPEHDEDFEKKWEETEQFIQEE